MDMKRISRLIERIYCAGMGQMPWSDVLAEMAQAGSQSHPNEFECDLAENPPNMYGRYRLDADPGAPYVASFGLIGLRHLHTAASSDLAPAKAGWLIEQSKPESPQPYGALLRPQTVEHAFGALAGKVTNAPPAFAMQRARRSRFPARDQKLISILFPHIRRSLQMQNALRQARRTTDTETGLSLLQLGVIVLAADGHVVFANRTAIDILHRMGISLSGGRLSRAKAQADGVIKAIEYAAAAGTGQFPRHPFFMTMSIDRRTEVDLVLASEDETLARNEEPDIALTLRLRTGTDLTERLRSSFHLTPSEAALAISLSRGETLADIARSRGTSVNTVRVQLRSAFAKTGCRRQSDLMRLVLRLPHR